MHRDRFLELLRWMFFIPSAFLCYMFGSLIYLSIELLFIKILGSGASSWYQEFLAYAIGTGSWFIGGIAVAPHNFKRKNSLFILTLILALFIVRQFVSTMDYEYVIPAIIGFLLVTLNFWGIINFSDNDKVFHKGLLSLGMPKQYKDEES